MKATTYSIIRFIVWINCFALALSANVYAVNQATFYVSPAGNDADEGTEAAPFKTIARAQKAVRYQLFHDGRHRSLSSGRNLSIEQHHVLQQ